MRPRRLDPPRLALTPELRWVVLRAWGPTACPFDGTVRGPEVLELARRLALASRIGVRQPRELLFDELGYEAARDLFRAAVAAAALFEDVRQVVRVVGEAAIGAVPAIVLKGAALVLAGTTPLGARRMSDLDILVDADALQATRDLLQPMGFRAPDLPDSEHYAVPLLHRRWGGVELHTCLPGVRLGRNGDDATARDLADAGLLQPLEGAPGVCVPARRVLLAHVLVHGLNQHLLAPSAYPPARVLSDLADLEFCEADVEGVWTWLTATVAREELISAARLVRALVGGDIAGIERDSGADVLLRHVIAGATDDAYARSLRVRNVVSNGSGSVAGRFFRGAWGAIAKTPKEMEVIYGGPRSSLWHAFARLWRPLDIAFVRLPRYLMAGLRFRLQRRRQDAATLDFRGCGAATLGPAHRRLRASRGLSSDEGRRGRRR